jgi:hypothetical protein
MKVGRKAAVIWRLPGAHGPVERRKAVVGFIMPGGLTSHIDLGRDLHRNARDFRSRIQNLRNRIQRSREDIEIFPNSVAQLSLIRIRRARAFSRGLLVSRVLGRELEEGGIGSVVGGDTLLGGVLFRGFG